MDLTPPGNKDTIYDAIIIGAGISGLACARTLQKRGLNFLVLSKDIGGRILRTKDNQANLGAYYVHKGYKNIWPWLKINRRISWQNIYFYKDGKTQSIWKMLNLRLILEGLRLMLILKKFKRKLEANGKRMETQSFNQALSNDEHFKNVFYKPATQFIKENKLENITTRFLNQAIASSIFCDVSSINTGVFLSALLPLIMPTFEYEFKIKDFIAPFEKQIIITEAQKTVKKQDTYEILADAKKFQTKNLILAVPAHTAAALLQKEIKVKCDTNVLVYYLEGELVTNLKKTKGMLIFSSEPIYCALKQQNGNYIIYAKNKIENFSKYFIRYKLIENKYWNPALQIMGNETLAEDRGDCLYMIGDYNAAGLEAAYLTGVYIGNTINYV